MTVTPLFESREVPDTLDVLDIIERNRPKWMDLGSCRQYPQNWWYYDGAGGIGRARTICESCPVQGECLTYALDHHEKFGMWGGKSERQRRRMLRRTA